MKKIFIHIERVIVFISNMISKSQRILGLILLIPPLLSVYAFMYGIELSEFSVGKEWTGEYYSFNTYTENYELKEAKGAGGYTSALPIYLGIMAIAGSYLIKGNNGEDKSETK